VCQVRGVPETLKTLAEKKPVVITGGENDAYFGFFSKTISYVQAAGTELILFEGVDLSLLLDRVLKQCPARQCLCKSGSGYF
jgi:hypothetical protein